MSKILVTGASGSLGKGVVNALLNKTTASQIAVLVRDPAKAADLAAKGVQVIQGDYNDYASLVNAFKGTDKLYFVSGNDLAARFAQHQNVVKAATETKVGHIIYTSFQRKTTDSTSPIAMIAGLHLQTEEWIKASGLTYTILKHGLYLDILPMFIGDKAVETGTLYFPAGEGRAAFTLRSDLAEGGAAILVGKGHENKTYEFAAEHSYSFQDIAKEISAVTGKQILYVSPSQEEYAHTLSQAGVPAEYVGMFAGFGESIKQGEFDIPDLTLSTTIGKKTTGMAGFIKQAYANNH